LSRARARGKMAAMLEDKAPTPRDASSDDAGESVLELREMLGRMQAELQFEKTRNAALNFEVARLKRWRFGSSSESLDATTQAGLFDAILADTLLEDIAGQQAAKPAPRAPAKKRKAVRQALPANLPRIDHHYELEQTHCACGSAFKRIGEEVSEQLDCVPAQFFVLRHIRGKYACACCETIQAAALPAQMIDKGIPAPGLLAQAPWPSTTITCRCTARPRSTRAQACTSRARAWPNGWASAACA
jgi:transposase